jgi:hypothetical protein
MGSWMENWLLAIALELGKPPEGPKVLLSQIGPSPDHNVAVGVWHRIA